MSLISKIAHGKKQMRDNRMHRENTKRESVAYNYANYFCIYEMYEK